jgi:(1->4)-alpha-D-glucan 1-alpha-D-glucosylmutase
VDASAAEAVDVETKALNVDPDRLDALLRRQNFQLAYWRTASEEIDYRRFFNIETLVGLRMEDPAVAAAHHALVLELVREGTIEGLRVDHADGLRDPVGYLEWLAEHADGVYTVVEKILQSDEALPPSWPVAGTSGYDFLIRTNNLFVATEHEQEMTETYTEFTEETAAYADVAHAAKHQIMREELAAEVDRLIELLAQICEHHRRHGDHTRRELRDALREFVGGYDVYRTYVRPPAPPSDADRRATDDARRSAAKRRPDLDAELLDFLAQLARAEHTGASEVEFVARLQQLTAPVMAKGVEDTAFYRYHRLVSLNEVGGSPARFGTSVGVFHEASAAAAREWPDAMLTLSTHDTKRSADVRARVNVLSELPGAWRDTVHSWAARNERHRTGEWPDRNAEYLLYQTLVGAWPIDADRVSAFMAKATREAKVHTSWTDPAGDYDEALDRFVRAVLADAVFVAAVERFLADHRIVARGLQNAVAQTVLLLTAPGVPDVYQGTELLDLSLVDPDNRRPVDFTTRRASLTRVRGTHADAVAALDAEHLGASKLWVAHRVLDDRRHHPDRYAATSYEPLPTAGPRAEHVLAFARDDLAVVVPVRTDLDHTDLTDVNVTLPAGHWRSLFDAPAVAGGARALQELWPAVPVAVLVRDPG